MNKFIVAGNLTKDPTLGYTHLNGTPVCNFVIETKNYRRKSNGDDIPMEYIRVVVWGEHGVSMSKVLKEGMFVQVVGRAQAEWYVSKATNEPRSSLTCVAEEIEMGYHSSQLRGLYELVDGEYRKVMPDSWRERSQTRN